MRGFLLLLMCLALAGCGSSSRHETAEEESSDERIAGETYEEYDTRRDSYEGSRGEYAGDGCTVNCSGHDAGYQWAEDHDISDPDDCGGKSWSFIEGCQAYAEGKQNEAKEDGEGGAEEE